MKTWWRQLSGNHPKILQLNTLIDEVNHLWEEVLSEGRQMGRLLQEVFHYETLVFESDTPLGSLTVPAGAIKIVGTLMNRRQFEEYADYYAMGYVPMERIESVAYVWSYGSLIRLGGGFDFLKESLLVAPAEWEALKSGEVPARLIKSHWHFDGVRRTLALSHWEAKCGYDDVLRGPQLNESEPIRKFLAKYPELSCRFQ